MYIIQTLRKTTCEERTPDYKTHHILSDAFQPAFNHHMSTTDHLTSTLTIFCLMLFNLLLTVACQQQTTLVQLMVLFNRYCYTHSCLSIHTLKAVFLKTYYSTRSFKIGYLDKYYIRKTKYFKKHSQCISTQN